MDRFTAGALLDSAKASGILARMIAGLPGYCDKCGDTLLDLCVGLYPSRKFDGPIALICAKCDHKHIITWDELLATMERTASEST